MSTFYLVRYKEGARWFVDQPEGLANAEFKHAHHFDSKEEALREARVNPAYREVYEVSYGVTWEIKTASQLGKDYVCKEGISFAGQTWAQKRARPFDPKRLSREEAWSICKGLRKWCSEETHNVFKVVRFMRKVKA